LFGRRRLKPGSLWGRLKSALTLIFLIFGWARRSIALDVEQPPIEALEGSTGFLIGELAR